MALIETALERALSAYRGKRDKAGQPYVLHPLRLMAKMHDEISQVVSLLHDVIEDSDVTAEDLREDGFPEIVIEAVVALTRQAGESYMAFIERLKPNELARKVKLADIEDNLNVLRLVELNEQDLRRVQKYHKAWHNLQQV
ncbi:GTP pyrophosphokinase [Pseudomonas aeruginosa]